jgi:thiamine pyrophosphate-dependent acetolactate synthase large subunit-like protein
VEVRSDGVYVGVAAEPRHVRTVSDLMVETMVEWGVTHVFGMVGHSNLGFADAMRRQENSGRLTYIGIRHEGAAAFAASAYGKLTGRPAACFAIAGPGSTNLLTGLYDAKVDRAPVLAISGQVPSKVLGRGAFQDLDLTAAFADVACFSRVLNAQSDAPEMMTLALRHACLERGVGHLVLPDELQVRPAADDAVASTPAGRVAPPAVAPPGESLARAADRVRRATRPVIIVGHGARGHMDGVLALARTLSAPVITTFKAKGLVGDDDPLAGGVLGRSGTPVASWLMNEADLLLVFGASFSDHTGIAPYKPIVQIDRDPVALGRFHPVTEPVLGDIGVTAGLLSTALADGDLDAIDQRPDIAARWAIWRDEKRRRALDDSGGGIAAARVFDALTRAAPDDAVIAVDVGNNTYSFGRYFESRRQAILMSGYLGSIGFGFPAAMGAWAAVQADGSGRRVLAVAGDGGFGQYMGELTTAVKYRMDIVVVLLNNSELGKITKEQRSAGLETWQTGLHNPSFADYARLCGAWGRRVERSGDVDAALAEALAQTRPALVEVVVDPDLV